MGERVPESIAIVGRTMALEIGERVEVEWSLNVEPDLRWTEVFQFTSVDVREGPVDWMEGAGPDVVDGTIRWFVPTASLANAESEVVHRLKVANERHKL
jgi:hypothetical protein